MELQYGNCVIKHTEYGHTVSAKISTTNSIFLEKMLLCTTVLYLLCKRDKSAYKTIVVISFSR